MEERMNLISNRQPELPFEFNAFDDASLRAAYARSHLKLSFRSRRQCASRHSPSACADWRRHN